MDRVVSLDDPGFINFQKKRKAKLTEYRDHTMRDYIYFWTIENVRVSGIYTNPEEAKTWDGTSPELT